MHPMLNTAIKAARRAATVIQRASFDVDRVVVTEKQHNDFVTDVDQAAEQAIIETLLKAYPEHAILAEESGASRNLNDESEFVWIIDPIDGTTNFMHGYANYCVSIALMQRGATSTRSAKPMVFMARATEPTLPARLVSTSTKRRRLKRDVSVSVGFIVK